MQISVPKATNAAWVENVMCLMDGAIHCAELELHFFFNDAARVERRLQWARKSYGDALRFAGRVSFDAVEVSVFESKSVRLEKIIRELQQRLSSWKASPEQEIEQEIADCGGTVRL